jgi:AraC family transcriptional regulator of adaptative response / DNA-3-methyladenine glycosylase II
MPLATPDLPLPYHPPFDWAGVLRFLSARLLKGVEQTDESSYARTVRLDGAVGSVRIRLSPDRGALLVDPDLTLMPVVATLLARFRALFDLDARPDVIAECLSRDPRLAPSVARSPGLRVPGAFDGFELGVRAILGQQVTVRAATTIAGRFAAAFGEPIGTPFPALTHLSPTPDRVAAATMDEVASVGIIQARARSILALAQAVATGALVLEPGADPAETVARLMTLPGIGPWTAQYIAMRALRWPDAFPREDIALLSRLGGVKPLEAEALSQAWRPWRSYAVLHLWESTP